MAEIIGVRFKEVGKIYYFDPNGGSYRVGEPVVVETSRGTECGTVAISNREVDQTRVVKPLKKVTRPATQEDLRRVEENRKKEEKAFRIAQEKIALCKLEMKLVEVEYAFDGSKILFYFTADGRVDFRELVKELAGVFRTRIELRQIAGRSGHLRAAVLLRQLPGGVPACFHQDGEGAGAFSQSHQDKRGLRPADVLPEVRAGRL